MYSYLKNRIDLDLTLKYDLKSKRKVMFKCPLPNYLSTQQLLFEHFDFSKNLCGLIST